jgi:putative PIN family toxin of toxin-antitoxin system
VKVFLDTNVLVSAFATRGLSADIFELVLIDHELITGRGVLQELDSALRVKIRMSAALRAEIIELVSSEAEAIVEEAPEAACRADPDDRLILGEAVAGGSDMFVTGDADLLALGAIGQMQILNPRQFWELLRTG